MIFYSKPQQALIEKIVREVTSEDGFARLQKQMDDDDGAMGAIALGCLAIQKKETFNGTHRRHLTLRADG